MKQGSFVENPEAVLFDLDGTLADTLPLFVGAYSSAAKGVGMRISNAEIPFRCFGKTEQEICERAGVPEKENEFRRIYFKEIKRTIIPNSKPAPGAKKLLDSLERAGVGLGITSFAYGWYVSRVLKNCGLAGYFRKNAVLSREAVRRQKPAPDQALLACRILKARPAFTLVVGDSSSDIGMANSAGCFSVLYRPIGYSRYSRRAKNGPVPIATVRKLSSLSRLARFP